MGSAAAAVDEYLQGKAGLSYLFCITAKTLDSILHVEPITLLRDLG